MSEAYQVVKAFERRVGEYTGAPYGVAVDSCTSALFLCLQYYRKDLHSLPSITLPHRTYPSVACSVVHSGFRIKWDFTPWTGIYRLDPTNIYDSAVRFSKDMYIPGSLMCLSFHGKKILNIGEGGMILTSDAKTAEWLRLARFSGRHEKPLMEDKLAFAGWKANMSPELAARGLVLMDFISDHNDDLCDVYPDLSTYEFFNET